MRSKSGSSKRARRLRKSQTQAEGRLWSLLRSKQLCGLKFRRQHPIGPFFADFACQSHHTVIELDGDYHDHILGLPYTFRKRTSKRSGVMSENAPNNKPREGKNAARPSPHPAATHPAATASDLPFGEVKTEDV